MYLKILDICNKFSRKKNRYTNFDSYRQDFCMGVKLVFGFDMFDILGFIFK